MLEGLIYFSPITVLIVALLVLMFGEHEEEDAYNCFRFSRIMLILSWGLSIIFYNKTTIIGLTVGNKFTLLFDCMLYAGALALLYPARKWFASMNIPAYVFCGCLFLTILSGSLLISSDNLVLTACCCTTLLVSNYMLLRQGINKKESDLGAKVYMITALTLMFLLAAAVVIFYEKSPSMMYADLRTTMEIGGEDWLLFAAAAAVVVVFLLLLGLAPLHFCSTEILGWSGLPIFTYFLLVPLSAAWGGFIHLNVEVLTPILGRLRLFYMAVALLSVGFGAIGACCGQNIRKIFAYSTVFHSGIILLTMRKFTLNSINAGFVYLFVYMLAMYGICTCLFGLKRKGEYLFMLSELEGAAQKRPYISAVMLVFMFSLLGIPPFCGFLGLFSSLNYLALHHHFYQLIYLLSMMSVIGYAYLQIIRSMFFEERKNTFDRADGGIYATILLNVALMIVIALWPYYVTFGFRSMLEVLF